MPKDADRQYVRNFVNKKVREIKNALEEQAEAIHQNTVHLLRIEERLQELENGAVDPPEDDQSPMDLDQVLTDAGAWHGPHPSNLNPTMEIKDVWFDEDGQHWTNVDVRWEGTLESDSSGTRTLDIAGNCWIIAFHKGAWRAASFEWFEVNGNRKYVKINQFADHIKMGSLADWNPTPGEEIYFYLTPQTRHHRWKDDRFKFVPERTNIVRVEWR